MSQGWGIDMQRRYCYEHKTASFGACDALVYHDVEVNFFEVDFPPDATITSTFSLMPAQRVANMPACTWED